MNKLGNRSLIDIYKMASSTEPTPGGGGVTNLCGALGIGLILKALRISSKSSPTTAYTAEDGELDSLADRLIEFADIDEKSFRAYIDALQLPRSNDAEKELRSSAIERAAIAASEAALEAFEVCCEAISIADRIRAVIKKNIEADILAGVGLLEAAAATAAENVRANMPSIRNEEFRIKVEERLRRRAYGEGRV